MVAVISDCTTDSEVRGLVKYTISGSADPYILEATDQENESFSGEYWSTGIWLPSFNSEYDPGPAFSSQNMFWTEATPGSHAEPSVSGEASVKPNLKPALFSGEAPKDISGSKESQAKKEEPKKENPKPASPPSPPPAST